MAGKTLGKRVVVPMSAKTVEKLAKLEGRHAVGGCPGLYIQSKGGARSWVLRVLIDGKRHEIGLGSFFDVTLEEARGKGVDLRRQIRNGVDPLAERVVAKAARQSKRTAIARAMTFEMCVNAYLEAHEDTWKNAKHRQQWRNTLETYAAPVFGKLPVAEIDLSLVMKCLEPIWKTKTETASRLRGRIESVLDWATVRGYRKGENPARWKGHLDNLLPAKNKVAVVEHHAALPYAEIGAFMAELRKMDGLGARAFEFAVLCGSRSEEVRGAAWGEIDMKARMWTIPFWRMKMRREHRVPLSDAAMAILEGLPRIAGTDLVFPGRKGPMTDKTLNSVLKRLQKRRLETKGIGWIEPSTGRQIVQHGFRSTFRDWAAEMTSYPHEVCEMALAHGVGDKVEAAYRRGDLFEKRRRIMEDWAKFCASPAVETDNVVPIRTKTAA